MASLAATQRRAHALPGRAVTRCENAGHAEPAPHRGGLILLCHFEGRCCDPQRDPSRISKKNDIAKYS